MEFTGKLGRRTKYQTFDTSLLVMNLVEQKEEPIISIHDQDHLEEDTVELINAKELVSKERIVSNSETSKGLSASTFDEESILLETPKFV